MKNDPWIRPMVYLLALSAITSVFLLLFMYVPADRKLRTLQGQVNEVMTRRGYVNALVADVVEYSKTHPAIDPVLESINIKQPKP